MSCGIRAALASAAWRALAWVAVGAAGWLVGAAGVAAAEPVRFLPPTYADSGEPGGGPLDVSAVRFGQVESMLVLRVKTAGNWAFSSLSAGTPGAAPRSVCLELVWPAGSGRLCGGRVDGKASVLWGAGATAGVRVQRGLVGRPDDRTIDAYVPPASLGLAPGTHVRWRIVTRDGASERCVAAAPCVDASPDEGWRELTVRAVGLPRCFGAAARGPGACSDPALARVVYPTPDDAVLTPNSYCRREQSAPPVYPCSFGLAKDESRGTVALVGDSHSAHLRAAMEVVAQARRLRVFTLQRSGCNFTWNPSGLSAVSNRRCKRWSHGVARWLRDRPDVEMIVVGSHRLPDTPERRADFRRMWSQLPAHLRHIVIVRDTPVVDEQEAACVRRRIARRQITRGMCDAPRARVLPPDPMALAARTSGDRRVHLVDLTRYFCGPQRCLAVVGGALVRRDTQHLTRQFSASLGPALLRELDGWLPR